MRPLDPTDDDDDDEQLGPAFSLAGELVSEQSYVPEFGEPRHLEVVSLAGETVTDLQLFAPGESFYIGPEVGWWRRRRYRDIPARRRLLQVTREGAWTTLDGVAGTLVRDGTRKQLDVAGDVALLRPGDLLHLSDGERSFHVRFVTPPEPTPRRAAPLRKLLRKIFWPAWGCALAVHVIGLLIATVVLEPWPVHTPFALGVELDPEPIVAFLPVFQVMSSCTSADSIERSEVHPLLCCLVNHGELSNELHISWTVRRNGRVRRVRVEPTPSPAANACIMEVIGDWHLSPRQKPQRVRYQLGLLGF